MEDVMIFEADNRVIKITSSVFEMMKNHLQTTLTVPESGGILIGRENISDDNLIIEFATSPMPKDIQKRTRFIRRDKGHLDFYLDLYKNSDSIYRYVGEWHTHPECIPHYSIIDQINWEKISRNAPYDQFYYHFILGTKAINVWKIKGTDNFNPDLIYTMEL